MTSSSLARCIAGTALSIVFVSLPIELFAQVETPARQPRASESAGTTVSGSYLAARHASAQRDAAAAAAYYGAALRRDPKNGELLDRAFLSLLVDGNIEEAAKYADRVTLADKTDRVSRLVIGVNALKNKQYAVARRELMQSVRGPITDLTATLLTAWSMAGAGDANGAVAAIDRLTGPDWYSIFKDLHAGMIYDLADNQGEAGKRFANAYKLDPTALRVVETYASWLSRNGKADTAIAVLADFDKALPNHPLIRQAIANLGGAGGELKIDPAFAGITALAPGSSGEPVKRLQAKLGIAPDGKYGKSTQRGVAEFQQKNGLPADGVAAGATLEKLRGGTQLVGRPLPRIAESATAGAAEALYGLGASLGRRGGEDLGLVYLQLSLYLAPSHPMALLSLADLYEALKKPELAIKIYERIPANSPLHRNAAIQMATDLDALDRGDEAEKQLDALIKQSPDDLEAITALGNVLRGHKKFAECADVYTKGVETLKQPEKSNWMLFYFRGICLERSKQWPKAEADLKKALELFPEQPHVLNYLGYSWIDQGINLDDGMAMIKRAVQQRPDDGYIVDSLGWAYYRLGNYEEATKELERAIDLKPEDPTINDHLGDAYWRIGRTLEARFQWAHARDLKPDPEDLPKIETKIKDGLPDETQSQAKAGKKTGDGG